MKEKLYTIPVTDAFKEECECPLCSMKHSLEEESINYTMGPSYMEDDVRLCTDKLGFCNTHIRQLYANQNRLGLALMLHSHLNKTLNDIEYLSENSTKPQNSLFKKKRNSSDLIGYATELKNSCFVCDRIERIFERYLVTVLSLYKTEKDFRDSFLSSKGICTEHFAALYELAPEHLSGSTLTEFIDALTGLYLINMKRVKDDLEWFIDKFDYRNQDAPWKNSQDALIRTILKTNGIFLKQ